jgi:probable phosphoglycerate mutase
MAGRRCGTTRRVNDTTLIYLIRHGDAMPHLDLTLDSAADYDSMDLSPKGRAQADALAIRLRAHATFSAIYSSPTPRAHQTAEPSSVAFQVPIVANDAFKEVQMETPSLDVHPPKLRAAKMREHLEHLARIAMREGSWASVPGAESSSALRARVVDAVEALVVKHAGGNVAIFSHAGTINAYVAAILGIARDFFFPTTNTGVTIVRAFRDYRILERLNDVAHLEDAGLMAPVAR